MNIEQRIESLESDLNRVRSCNRWLVAALLLVGAGAIAGQGRAPLVNEDVRAKRFTLLDENGRPRAALGMTEMGPHLTMRDENGKIRAALLVNEKGTLLSMRDENDKLRAALGVNEKGTLLSMSDENDKLRFSLSVDEDGPFLGMRDENGKVTWRAP